ncbi:MAG: hypothetical protein ACSHYA_06875 [Opitutaceae bacterium]
MPQTTKITIQHKNGSTYGPYHWKHIIEWHEFDMVGNYTWVDKEGGTNSISELIDTVGVPATICTNTILHAPMHQGQLVDSESVRKLKVLGFPEINGSVNNDLGAHLVKRLLMSEEALNAEDPDFDTSGIESIAALLPDATDTPISSAQPEIMRPDPKPDVEPESTSEAETKPSQPTEDISQKVIDPSINPFIEGEEVKAEELNEDYTPIKRKGAGALVFLVIAILAIAGGGGAFVVMQQQSGDEETIEETSNEVAPVTATEATELKESATEMVEAVESTVDEVVESAEEVVENAAEDIASKISEVIGESNDAMTSEVDEAEAELYKAITDSILSVQGESGIPETDESEDISETTEETAEAELSKDSETVGQETVEATEELEGTLDETTSTIEAAIEESGTELEEAADELSEVEEPDETTEPAITINSSGEIVTVEEEEEEPAITINSSGEIETVEEEAVDESEDSPIEKFPDYAPSF